jgi:phosphoribosylglycinamide formyltransferase-1
MSGPVRLGFLASHGGSSMRAIVGAIQRGELDAQAAIAIGNNGDSPALAFAREQGLHAMHISGATEGGPEAADRAIAEALERAKVGLVVLSGYMRKLGERTLARFEGRILNVHPALLPRYGGQGMYGARVHAAVLASGDRETGATIHWVDGEYDHGAIVRQAAVPVLDGDTVETLQARVIAMEPELYIEALRGIIAAR